MPSRLPRSLDPLPGEVLPGYLLRLAHRLDRSPARLLHLSGAFAKHMRLGPVTHLEPEAGRRFALLTGLRADEVAGLCLSALTHRYAPLQPTYLGRRRDPARLVTNEAWVFGRWSRYCPQCLAGDGSPIQNSHGGAWQRTWRLPPVFACTVHRRLLAHACPACRQPALHLTAGTGRVVPCDRVEGLHPTQCRNQRGPGSRAGRVPCGHPLDQPGLDADSGSSAGPLGQSVLRLQQRILDLLDPALPDHTATFGEPTTASRYFTDLRLIANLVCVTWPVARRLAPAPGLTERLDEHVAERRARLIDMETHNDKVARHAIYDQPPADAAATAALVAIADRILTGRSPARGLLGPLTNGPDARRWAAHFIEAEPHCSSGLSAALATHVARYRRQSPGARRRSATSNPTPRRSTANPPSEPVDVLPIDPAARRYGSSHIPAFLPEAWYTAHFPKLPGLPERHLRRTVPILLLQSATPSSVADAARLLGVPANLACHSYNVTAAWFRASHDGAAFIDAVHRLAHTLDQPTNTDQLIDYAHRRSALAQWRIPAADWRAITVALPRGRNTELGDRKHNTASALVWTTVTSGEHLFAPHRASPAGYRPGSPDDYALSIDRAWYRTRVNKPGRHYPRLRQLLDDLAERVARQIDQTSPART